MRKRGIIFATLQWRVLSKDDWLKFKQDYLGKALEYPSGLMLVDPNGYLMLD